VNIFSVGPARRGGKRIYILLECANRMAAGRVSMCDPDSHRDTGGLANQALTTAQRIALLFIHNAQLWM